MTFYQDISAFATENFDGVVLFVYIVFLLWLAVTVHLTRNNQRRQTPGVAFGTY